MASKPAWLSGLCRRAINAGVGVQYNWVVVQSRDDSLELAVPRGTIAETYPSRHCLPTPNVSVCDTPDTMAAGTLTPTIMFRHARRVQRGKQVFQ